MLWVLGVALRELPGACLSWLPRVGHGHELRPLSGTLSKVETYLVMKAAAWLTCWSIVGNKKRSQKTDDTPPRLRPPIPPQWIFSCCAMPRPAPHPSTPPRRAPSLHCRDAKVYGMSTTALHDYEPLPLSCPFRQVFFLPVTPEFVEQVIRREKPDGIVISMGGQTALNCAVRLHEAGILEKYNVQVGNRGTREGGRYIGWGPGPGGWRGCGRRRIILLEGGREGGGSAFGALFCWERDEGRGGGVYPVLAG